MAKKKLKRRYFIYEFICILVFCALFIRLADLTIDKGEAYYTISQERKTVELTLRGVRGNILDRNGIPMAINKQIYVVELDNRRLPGKTDELNEMLASLIELVEKNGDKVIDNIPIKYDKANGFYYDWGSTDPDVEESRYKRWIDELALKEEDFIEAREMFGLLKEKYEIEEDLPDDLARKVLSFRIDIFLNRYREYTPIKVAEDVNSKTVALVETFAPDLPGVNTSVETSRYYPMGDTAAHIIGYVGKISQENADEYKEMGYDISKDKIGVTGIEAAFESCLTGNTSEKHGKLWAETNASGRVIKVLDEQLPQNGDDVVLSLDSRLQKSTENILKTEIEKMREGLPPYDGSKNIAPLAKNGAAVVLDVHTGEILTMASYPSYDLNLFSKGISSDDYKALSEDPAKPLYPLAFQGRMTPGSIFKMVIAIAGLEEGAISLNETIYDKVYFTKYDKKNPPACSSKGGHGSENIVDALKHSCNYFFYETADRLGIDNINKWADELGLTGPTGLEILSPNSDYNLVANADVKLDREKYNMQTELISVMNKYGYFKDVKSDEEKEERDKCIKRLIEFDLTDDYRLDTKNIQNIFDEMGYFVFRDEDDDGKDDLSGKTEQRILYDKINASYDARRILIQYKRWKDADTVITGIGQSYTQISPLAIARYVAAIANDGDVLETHVVKSQISQDGDVLDESKPNIINQLNISPQHLDAVRTGMHKVVYETGGRGGGGTAARYFADLDPSITLAGKTGTAQTVAGNEEKNNAWFVSFTPYEKPEVAVVVAIPNGRTAGNAAPIARKIIEEYYRLKGETHVNPIQRIYELQK